MVKLIRDKLIQIPWISELGTMRRNLLNHKWDLGTFNQTAIREKYASGKNTSEQTFLSSMNARWEVSSSI